MIINKSNEEIIEEIISNTFRIVQNVFDFQRESEPKSFISSSRESSIIFPKKTDNKDRISEQELRFIFVEQFNKSIDVEKNKLFYSIETPTENLYDFSGNEPRVIGQTEHKNTGAGRSANIDLVIFQKDGKHINRIAIIEFKALNPSKKNYKKDILKLQTEPGKLKYFIHIIKNCDDDTIKNIKGKIGIDKIKFANIKYKCWCLDKKGPIDFFINPCDTIHTD